MLPQKKIWGIVNLNASIWCTLGVHFDPILLGSKSPKSYITIREAGAMAMLLEHQEFKFL